MSRAVIEKNTLKTAISAKTARKLTTSEQKSKKYREFNVWTIPIGFGARAAQY